MAVDAHHFAHICRYYVRKHVAARTRQEADKYWRLAMFYDDLIGSVIFPSSVH